MEKENTIPIQPALTKIEICKDYKLAKPKQTEIREFVENAMSEYCFDGGQIEHVECQLNNLTKAFGKLVAILAGKKILNADDVLQIADKGYDIASALIVKGE